MAAIGRIAPRRIHPMAFLGAALAIAAGTYLVSPLVRPSPSGPVPQAAQSSAGSPATSAAPVFAPGGAGSAGSAGGANAAVGALPQIDHSIGIWAANLGRNPRDFLSATNLSLLYHARGRLTADLDDYSRSLQAVEKAVEAAPNYAPARALEATVEASLHDFAGALATASAVYQEDASQLGALATVGDAQLELGRYADAMASYETVAVQAPGAAIDARLARLAFLTGDASTGLRLARQARDEAVADARLNGEPRSIDLVFYEYQLGEMARLTGGARLARSAYQAALAIRADDLGSLVGLARIDAHDGQLGSAIAGLRRAAAIAPQPDTLALLGDLLAETGDEKAASQQYATVRAIRSLSELASSVYDRQLLLFELDHDGASEQTLDRARQALLTRGDVYGHDVVAWALYRLGRASEAKVEMAAAMAQHTPDARLLYHAGAIDLATGDPKGATALLRQALSLSSGLDPLQLAEAQHLLAAATV